MNYKDVNLYEYAKKRFYRIMIPYFCFEFISFLLAFIVHYLFRYLNLGNVYLNLDIKAALLDSITCVQTPSYMGIISHLWFFPCIYVVDIFFMVIKRYIHINIIFIIICSLLISYGTQFLPFRLPFTIDIAFMGLFFLLMGYRFKYLIPNMLYNKWGGVLSVPIFFYLVYNNKHLFLMFVNSYGNYLYAIPTACLGIYAFIFLVIIINRCHILPTKLFLFLSKNSLLLFPLHLIFLNFYAKLMEFSKMDQLVQGGYVYSWTMLFLILGSVFICVPFINKYFPILTGNYIPEGVKSKV